MLLTLQTKKSAGGGVPSPIFSLPLTDSGAGAVNTTPSIATGSAVATFSRASTAYTVLSTQLWAQVSSGTARSYYNFTTGIYEGFLAEATATNQLLWSNDLTNAAWVATTMTTAATSTGPDGVTNSATRVTASAGNALILQTITQAATNSTLSLWVKRITGTGNFDLTQNGVAFTTVTTTGSWTKVQLTASILNPTLGFRIVTSGDAFDIWCCQFEAGAGSTSPIPTTTATATRAADSLSYVKLNNASGAAGSVYVELKQTTGAPFALNGIPLGGSTAASDMILNNQTTYRIFDGVNSNSLTLSLDAVHKCAFNWVNAGNKNVYADGTAATATAYTSNGLFSTASFFVGAGIAGREINAPIKNLRIYSTSLSDAQLQAMTT